MKKIEIIGLIYKSPSYLKLLIQELNKDYSLSIPGFNVNARVVANDPTEKIKNLLTLSEMKFSIYNDPKPEDYYLNRVYRCYNYAAVTSDADVICFINSDMIFSDCWLENLVKHLEGNIPCSRLVESGKFVSGMHGIGCDFGRSPDGFQYEKWNEYVKNTSSDEVKEGGLYMPCLFDRQQFIDAGMYPEGNIYKDGVGTRNGNVVYSGDMYFFELIKRKYGLKHVTVFNSLVYHIQEGEKDE